MTRHEALTETSRRESGQKIGLEGGVPLIATAKGEASFGQSRQSSLQRKEGGETNLMYEVEKKIAGTHQFVLIDDFHYIASREVQVRLAQQIKDMFERGVKIAVAQVLHKRDDILRSNPELRGRLRPFEFKYWNHDDLVRIGKLGFPHLRIDVPSEVLERLQANLPVRPSLCSKSACRGVSS